MKNKKVKFSSRVVTNLSDPEMKISKAGNSSDIGYGSSFTNNNSTCCFSNCDTSVYTGWGDYCEPSTYPFCTGTGTFC